MQEHYTYSRGFRIFVFCLMAPVAAMPLMAFYAIIIYGIKSLQEAFIAFVSILPGVLLVLYCINEMLSVVTSDGDGIRYRSFLYKRELLWDEIRGYRWKEGTLILMPAFKGKKKVRVSGQRRHCYKISDWIMARYPDLSDKVTDAVRLAAYQADPDYPHKIRMARYTARGFNFAAFALMVACLPFFRPLPFTTTLPWVPLLLIVVLTAIPAALVYHKGWLIVSENKKDGTLPAVLLAVLFAAAGLFAVGAHVYSLRLHTLWLDALGVTAVFTLLVVFSSRRMKISVGNKIWGIISFLIFFIPASFGSIVYLNTFFDRSTPQFFETTVSGKRISTGEFTSYYLVVLPWGPEKSGRSISVGKRKYDAAAINDTIRMELHQGALGLPWYRPLMPSHY
ncbi:hypothetical protein HF324_03690 [Chitinophaga oryzae]|uniref:PH domain-containing protein n=1 Tax=Chitinophaga oryzae TaxID=2725414 RepID=A0AAE6ZED2_9BACT|nr:hypothetical protein [Chitinophaga oryzae]QJB30505.1 hypothetical protein HF329_03990 [Chitinophaga oryzae]QJB37003.1 hypothetical protein HF324_03690 [Chitinophaga oryzae]